MPFAVLALRVYHPIRSSQSAARSFLIGSQNFSHGSKGKPMSKFLKINCTNTNRRQFYLELEGPLARIRIYSIRGFAHYYPGAIIEHEFDNLGFTDGLSLNMEIDGSDLILNAPAMYAMIAAITHELSLIHI